MGEVIVEDLGTYFSDEESAEAYKIAKRLSGVLGVDQVRVSKGSASIGGRDSYTPHLDYQVSLLDLDRGIFPGLGKLVRTIRFGSSGEWVVFAEGENPIYLPVPDEYVRLIDRELPLLKNWRTQQNLIGVALHTLLELMKKSIDNIDLGIQAFVGFV